MVMSSSDYQLTDEAACRAMSAVVHGLGGCDYPKLMKRCVLFVQDGIRKQMIDGKERKSQPGFGNIDATLNNCVIDGLVSIDRSSGNWIYEPSGQIRLTAVERRKLSQIREIEAQ